MVLYPPVILCIIVGTVSSLIYIKSGLPLRVEAKVAKADNQHNNKNPFYSQCFQQAEKGFPQENCFYLSPDKVTTVKQAPSAIVLGDSHASTLIRNIAEVANREGDGPVLFYGHQGCFPVQNLKQMSNTDGSCIKYSSYLKKLLLDYPEIPVIVISRYSVYFFGETVIHSNEDLKFLFYDNNMPDFKDAIALQNNAMNIKKEFLKTFKLLTEGRKVYAVLPVPEFEVDIPKHLARTLLLHGKAEDITIPMGDYYERNKVVLSMLKEAEINLGVTLLDPIPYLCNDDKCYGSEDEFPLYFDQDHLSEFGSKKLNPLFENIF